MGLVTPSSHLQAKVAVVYDKDIPAAVATHNLAILRPKGLIDPDYLTLITAFLRSNAVMALASGVHGYLRIRPSSLRSLILPAPDMPLSAALVDLNRAAGQLGEWSTQSMRALASAFDAATSMDDARNKVIEAGRMFRLRVEAADQLDRFGSIVRTLFPHPIALRWRGMEASITAQDDKMAYEAVLETAEVLLGYLALIALALAREASIALGSLTGIQQKIAGNGGGPGFGDWTAVLQEVDGAKKRRSLSPDHPLHELAGVLGDDVARAARARLLDRRNDKAHGRIVDQLDLPAILQQSFADLETLARRSEFLADWSLVNITSVEWDGFRREARLHIRRFRGDHVVVPTTTMAYPTSDIEKDSLYLADRDHRLYLLRPFLVGRTCPSCRNWSTFHIDVANGERKLKSLEHGHTMPCDQDPEILRAAGLL